jgi:hypothetical protein
MNHCVSLSLTNRKSSIRLHALYSPRTALRTLTPRRDQLVISGHHLAVHHSVVLQLNKMEAFVWTCGKTEERNRNLGLDLGSVKAGVMIFPTHVMAPGSCPFFKLPLIVNEFDIPAANVCCMMCNYMFRIRHNVYPSTYQQGLRILYRNINHQAGKFRTFSWTHDLDGTRVWKKSRHKS